MSKNDSNLVIGRNGLDYVYIDVGSERKVIFDMKTLIEIRDTLDDFIVFMSEMSQVVNYYYDFLEKIDDLLKKQEDDWSDPEPVEYSVSENYALYLKALDENQSKFDNKAAAEILEREYREEFGENDLKFEPETSYCFIYTENKEDAKRFLKWVYEKHIRPFIIKIMYYEN